MALDRAKRSPVLHEIVEGRQKSISMNGVSLDNPPITSSKKVMKE
jgi:hypothetical protein